MPDASDSTSTTDTATADTSLTETSNDSAQNDEVDLSKELERWKTEARKHENRAKENAKAAKELSELKLKSMSEQEQAVEKARQEAKREFSSAIVGLKFEAIAASRLEANKVETLVSSLDMSKFMDEDGQPDVKAIESFLDGIAPKNAGLNIGQGARGNSISPGDDQVLVDLLVSKVGRSR